MIPDSVVQWGLDQLEGQPLWVIILIAVVLLFAWTVSKGILAFIMAVVRLWERRKVEELDRTRPILQESVDSPESQLKREKLAHEHTRLERDKYAEIIESYKAEDARATETLRQQEGIITRMGAELVRSEGEKKQLEDAMLEVNGYAGELAGHYDEIISEKDKQLAERDAQIRKLFLEIDICYGLVRAGGVEPPSNFKLDIIDDAGDGTTEKMAQHPQSSEQG